MRNTFARRRGEVRRAVQRGFTLIELMLVVVIIGILITFSYPYFTAFNAKARGSEAQIVFNKLNTYFVNLYENNGTFATSDFPANYVSTPDPTSSIPVGTAAVWDSTIAGWQQVPFAFDGGLKMRYVYSIASDGLSITISAVGTVPGLGNATLTPSFGGGVFGNYMLTETISGSTGSSSAIVQTVEIPSM